MWLKPDLLLFFHPSAKADGNTNHTSNAWDGLLLRVRSSLDRFDVSEMNHPISQLLLSNIAPTFKSGLNINFISLALATIN